MRRLTSLTAHGANTVRRRGRNKPHRRRKTQEEEEEEEGAKVAKISVDYFSMNQDDVKASKDPMVLMTDEPNELRYMRAVSMKGLGEGAEMSWLIKDMHDELKSWGHPGGGGNKLTFKSDGEAAIKVVREALAQYHGGEIRPEQPLKGESQANGYVEEAGKTIPGLRKILKDQIECNAKVKLDPSDLIMQWMVRWAPMLHSRRRRRKVGRRKTAWQEVFCRSRAVW